MEQVAARSCSHSKGDEGAQDVETPGHGPRMESMGAESDGEEASALSGA